MFQWTVCVLKTETNAESVCLDASVPLNAPPRASPSSGAFIGSRSAASARRAGPWRGVYCPECVVALQLTPRTERVTLLLRTVRSSPGLSPGGLTQLLSARVFLFFLSCEFLLDPIRNSFCCICCRRSIFFYTSNATSVTDSAKMNKNGMMTKIYTRIRADPFTANYELAGKELGRWVCLSGLQHFIDGGGVVLTSCVCCLAGLCLSVWMSLCKSDNHIRFALCTC